MKRITAAAWCGSLAIAFLVGYGTSTRNVGVTHAQQAPAATAPPAMQGALPPGEYSRLRIAPDMADVVHYSGDAMARAHTELAGRVARGEPRPGGNPPDLFDAFVTRTHSYIMVHRPEFRDTGTPPGGEQHEGVTDVYFIVGGAGTVLVGGELQNRRVARPGEYLGPLVNGREIQVKVGDIVNIPPEMPHSTRPGPGGMTYVLMKVNVGSYPWSLINGTP